jgi:hypothetical protein
MQNEASYPLAWPAGWPRTEPAKRRRAMFGTRAGASERIRELTVAEATERLQCELDRLAAGHPVLSTNLEARLDGRPRSGAWEPDDSGAAVYFTLKERRTVLACDRWLRVADNIAAIAAHVEALRGIERWGVGTLEQAFRGYQAIEDLRAGVPWRRVFGIVGGEAVTLAQVETIFRARARETHPDRGGSHEAMAELNRALADARRELSI